MASNPIPPAGAGKLRGRAFFKRRQRTRLYQERKNLEKRGPVNAQSDTPAVADGTVSHSNPSNPFSRGGSAAGHNYQSLPRRQGGTEGGVGGWVPNTPMVVQRSATLVRASVPLNSRSANIHAHITESASTSDRRSSRRQSEHGSPRVSVAGGDRRVDHRREGSGGRRGSEVQAHRGEKGVSRNVFSSAGRYCDEPFADNQYESRRHNQNRYNQETQSGVQYTPSRRR